MENLFKKMESNSNLFIDQMNAVQNLFAGFLPYNNNFIIPYLISTEYFRKAEMSKWNKDSHRDLWGAYMDLFKLNIELFGQRAW